MQLEFLSAIAGTLLICGICCLVALPVGIYLALVLVRTNIPGRQFAWIALASQLAVPLYVFAGGWSSAFGTQGWIRAWWPEQFSATPAMTGLLPVALIHALAAIPWVCLIVSLGLIWTDRSQEESALVEGGGRQLLKCVLLPRLRIWIAAGCLWCCTPILTEMVVTNLYQVSSVAEQVYLDATRGTLSPATYLAAVTLCILPIVVSGWIWMRRAPRWREVVMRAAHHRPLRLELGAWRYPFACVTHAMVLAIVFTPLVSLVAKAGWTPRVDAQGITRYGWSSARFVTTVVESFSLFGHEFYWSLTLAVTSTGVSLVIAGTLITLLRHSRLRAAVSAAMCLLIAVPGPLAGMIVIYLLNRSQPAWLGWLYDTTLAAPVLAQQFRVLPLAWLLLISIAATIDQRTWDQLRLEGLTRWHACWRVLLPQTWAMLLATALLLLVISIGELSCTILVLPPGVATVSMRLFEMLHFGMRHQDSGLCGVLLLLGWVVALSIWKTLKDR